MGRKEYLTERLDDQIDWYDARAAWNQSWFKRLQVTIIIAGTLIPFISGLAPGDQFWSKFIIGFLGLMVAALTAILGLYKFQENWTQYRITCESLKREKHTFLAEVAPYAENDAFELLVERVESLISSEHTNWVSQGTATSASA